MQSNQIPTKFQFPFGKNAAVGTIRPIPVADQTATSPGAASLATGFPPATGQPLASGGIPPSLQDFNGLFNQDTAWAWWQAAGGTVQFDQAFCSAVGGYPAGALLSSATSPGVLFLSTAENNLTNPDSNASQGWVSITTAAALATANITGGNSQVWSLPGTYTWTAPPGVMRLRTRVWGGGGGGGGADSTAAGGSGGGGGGYSEGVFPVTPGQTVTLLVGAGGLPGVAGPTSTSQRGGTGGTSSVGAFNSALGGTGGWPGIGGLTSISGSGGSGVGGSINEVGGDGGLSVAFGGGSQVLVGQGGATPHGNGFNSLGVSGGGGTSPFYGTGGNSAGGANAPGGTAAPGRIELYW